jgi:hypothetical protein
MTFPATIAQATLDMVIGGLALLFLTGAGGDLTQAYHAASQMLAAYNAETPDELGLAAEIISLQLHTLEALSDASDPELSLNNILRLRGGAVSLSRESHKARRRLDQLQRGRRAGTMVQPAEAQSEAAQPQPAPVQAAPVQAAPVQPAQPQPAQPQPKIDNAPGLIETVREAIQTAQKTGGQNWSQSLQKRMTAKRITENLKKRQTEHRNLAAHLNAAAATIRETAPVG